MLHRIPLSEWASLHTHLVWVYDGPVSPEGRKGVVRSNHLTAWLIRHGKIAMAIGQGGGVVAAEAAQRQVAPAAVPFGIVRERLLAHGARLP